MILMPRIHLKVGWLVCAVLYAAFTLFGATTGYAEAPAGIDTIDNIVVIFMENRSFDNLLGTFPGANGIASAGEAARQSDERGAVYATLPQPMNASLKPPQPDPRFPANLPNGPFQIDKYVPLAEKTGDLVHRFYQEQMQINDGRMDRFVAVSDAKGLVMGYYDGRKTTLWRYAKRYVLADNFFHAAFGGSFLNHFWLVCACTPRFPGAPEPLIAKLSKAGTLIKDGAVTPDGYAVNTVQSRFMPHSPKITDMNTLLPPQEGVTIGDRLSEKGVSWAWYSGGWNNAVAGKPDELFQFHHQPFAYFKQFGDGTEARKEHLKDEADMMAAIAQAALPAVVFYKPLGDENEHPGYADVASGDRKLKTVMRALERSPQWKHMAVIITYDENGGLWDHVAPPKADRWGPGTRVPAVIVSPMAKRRFIDHTQYDTTSILRFIERRFNLKPLGSRDANANDLTNAFAL
jgi:phospholipase C